MTCGASNIVGSELLELCKDICNELRQELIYYRASVYKEETSQRIKEKIENFRNVTKLLSKSSFEEPFDDFAASGDHCVIAQNQQGECLFSTRVITLVKSLEMALQEYTAANINENSTSNLTSKLTSHRNQILSLCHHGSRHWDFFKTL